MEDIIGSVSLCFFDIDMGFGEDASGGDADIVRCKPVVTLLLRLPLPAATLRTTRGPGCEGGLPERLLVFSLSSLFNVPLMLINDRTLPFPLDNLVIIIIISGFNVSSELSGLVVPTPYA